MPSYAQRVSLLEFLYRKPGVDLSQIAGSTGILEGLIRDVFDDVQSSKMTLREQLMELRERNSELESYAHMVAHDLKDPLTKIITTSDVISHVDDLPPNELERLLGQIKATAFDMNKIISSLLLLAEVRRAEAPSEVVDMSKAVSNALTRLDFMIEERQARIESPESWPNAMGYEPWIEEVWANYLANALKHGGRPPAVELGASPDRDGMIRFWTRDHGPGLPPQAQQYIFSPEAPLPKSRRSGSGHGLGLSIVLQIIEKLGGKVGVESQAGQGSLFYFTLPAGPSSATQLQ